MTEAVELCTACGAAHTVDGRPRICQNLLDLAGALHLLMTQVGDGGAADNLADVCEDILGWTMDPDDDDREVFGEN